MENIDNYLENGIYGEKEIKKGEKMEYLSVFRERVRLCLTENQVRNQQCLQEVEQLLEKNKEDRMFLNGELAYDRMSAYIKIAKKLNVSFQIVNQSHDSNIGLVLAAKEAIE